MVFNQVIKKLLLAVVCSLVVLPVAAGELIASFSKLSKEAELIFAPPADLQEIPAVPMPYFHFSKAYKHKKLALEVRYAIRPLSRIDIDYVDPHGLRPEPGSVFPMVFTALVGRFSKRADAPNHPYIPEQAKSLFNANWATAAQFEPSKNAMSKYKWALLLAIHKNKRGDAYTLFLFDDPKVVKKTINKMVNALRFAP